MTKLCYRQVTSSPFERQETWRKFSLFATRKSWDVVSTWTLWSFQQLLAHPSGSALTVVLFLGVCPLAELGLTCTWKEVREQVHSTGFGTSWPQCNNVWSFTPWWYDVQEVTQPFCASVFSSVKWRQCWYLSLPSVVIRITNQVKSLGSTWQALKVLTHSQVLFFGF